ncbi:DUF397 domain-containing protein [Streptomyces sp. NPDC006372]|uniref:DUF397 domain-containing protein n=1 Tax=Streptomyces sp. NPDC006372 TaxID=3155599 RepID=UPI0033AD0B52
MPQWFKSSYSGGSGTECVECAFAPSGAFIRDSKQVSGAVIPAGLEAWCRFLDAVSTGSLPLSSANLS